MFEIPITAFSDYKLQGFFLPPSKHVQVMSSRKELQLYKVDLLTQNTYKN